MNNRTESLHKKLARMREVAGLLARAEDALCGASEYLETDDLESLVGVASRGVDRLIGRLELATDSVQVGEGIEAAPLGAVDLHGGLPGFLHAMAADENADLRRARAGFDRADFEARR